LLLLACCAARAAETNEIGRYQLFTGPIDVLDDKGDVHTRTALYRIDTVSGQTWRYDRELIRGPKDPRGVFAEAWSLMGEDYIFSSYVAIGAAQGDSAKANFLGNAYTSTNSFRQAAERMYWPPKRREELESMMAEAAIQNFLLTNRPSATNRQPPIRNRQ
jgi:hypothetical protein